MHTVEDRWQGWRVPGKRVREGARGSERIRESGLNADSTIPGRLAFHRQSVASTTDRKVRVLPPPCPPPLLPSPSHRYYARFSSADCRSALSLPIIRDRVALAPRLFLRASSSSSSSSSSSYPDSKSLVLSSRAVTDIASIESDVEGVLSGSSGRDRDIPRPPLPSPSPLPSFPLRGRALAATATKVLSNVGESQSCMIFRDQFRRHLRRILFSACRRVRGRGPSVSGSAGRIYGLAPSPLPPPAAPARQSRFSAFCEPPLGRERAGRMSSRPRRPFDLPMRASNRRATRLR